MPLGILLGSSPPAAATPGPASGPRPASSQPATGQTPRLISARSRRKLGGAIAITPFGSFAEACLSCVLARIMPGSCCDDPGCATGNSGVCPLFNTGVVPANAGPTTTYGHLAKTWAAAVNATRSGVYGSRRSPGRRGENVLKQAQLLPAAFRPLEMIGGQFRAPLVQAELFASG